MLSTIPIRKHSRPRSWTTPILIGLVIMLTMALSGLAALYYTNILTANPDVIIINQSANNNSTNGTGVVTKVTNYTKANNDKNQSNRKTTNDQKKENNNKNTNPKNDST